MILAGGIGFAWLTVAVLSWRLPYRGPLNKAAYWIVGAIFMTYGGMYTHEALRYMAAAIFRTTDFRD